MHDILQNLSPADQTTVLIHVHSAQGLELNVETFVALVAALESDAGAWGLMHVQGSQLHQNTTYNSS